MSAKSFSRRSYDLELMDQPNIPAPDLERNLKELEFINHWLGGHAINLGMLNYLKRKGFFEEQRVYSLADLGSGGGDTLRVMAQWFRKKKIKAKLYGLDLNPVMIQYAQEQSGSYSEISFTQQDVLSPDFPQESYDLVSCNLFCHHLQDEQLISLFAAVRQSGSTLILNDLHRHPLAYYSILYLSKLFSSSYLVKNDAPLSVKRSFRRQELIHLAQEAGVATFRIRWRWAFRFAAILYPKK